MIGESRFEEERIVMFPRDVVATRTFPIEPYCFFAEEAVNVRAEEAKEFSTSGQSAGKMESSFLALEDKLREE